MDLSHPALPAADAAFATALAESARGPDRDGVFALWLVVRAALGSAPPLTSPLRQADRLRAIAARLKSLNAPAPLRRALSAATTDLLAVKGAGPAVVLSHLVAPTSECLGKRLADAVSAAARAARPPAKT
jgi:hypothetical protein